MTNTFDKIRELRRTFDAIAEPGLRRKLGNYLDKISVNVRRYEARAKETGTRPTTDADYTAEQVEARYVAKKAIFDAMTGGRHITFLDSHEFKCSEMHTQMHCIRRDIELLDLPYVLHADWTTFGNSGKRCKVYWLEEKKEGAQ